MRNFEQETIEPSTLVVLDMDRTLLKSNRFVDVVFDSLRTVNPEKTSVIDRVQREERANRGAAYDYLAALEQGGLQIDGTMLASEILQNAESTEGLAEDLLAPDAIAAIDEINRRKNLSAIIMTAGGRETQALKIEVVNGLIAKLSQSKCALPAVVVDDSVVKAAIVGELFDGESGDFSIEKLVDQQAKMFSDIDGATYGAIEHVIVIDDKPKNVESRDERVRGVVVSPLETSERPDDALLKAIFAI